MSSNGISNMTVKELRAARDKIDALILEREVEEKAALRDKIAALAAQHGLTIAELFAGKPKKTAKPAVVKFRDPKNPDNTWSGRGRHPRWMGGRSPEQFRVSA